MIVTTRNSPVASTMGAVEQYNLKPLSGEDCWSIFTMHAYEGRAIAANSVSEHFRNKVVAKCGGLPLAAKTLGGLLRSKSDDEWDEILCSNILDLPQSGILPVLRLSYHYLPSHLKRCFAYCALFPKEYEFEEKELVFLWMAEGIIQQSRNNKQPEVLGHEYFCDLLSRSILQLSSSNNSTFVMHDLVHDLAQLVSGETSYRWEEANKTIPSVQKVRHFSYNISHHDGIGKFEVLQEVRHLRTFLPVPVYRYHECDMNNSVISDLLSKFAKLRVLSLCGHYMLELPDRLIEGLIHLSYLDFSYTQIGYLPESTCSLINLQILLLRNCHLLLKLPSNMRKLMNLRHLDITGAIMIKEMPFEIKELKSLQTLSNFIVGTSTRSSGLKDLRSLAFLGGELCISRLENVNDSQEAEDARLCEKQNLEALSLKWRSQFDNSRNEAVEGVLDMLKPGTNVKKLTITCYAGKRFPSWMGDPSFSRMEVLKLENCKNCTTLPSLGLLSSLKGLNELCIVECPKLSGKLPEHLPSLETLVVIKCTELVVPFSSYPKLSKFKMDKCKGLVCSTAIDAKLVKSMSVSNSLLQIDGCKGMINNDCPAADSVTISNMLEFGKFLKQGFQQITALWVGESQQLQKWLEWEKPEQEMLVLTLPEEISIEECCISLVSFPEINFLSNNLRALKIGKCRALKSLLEEIVVNNSQLEALEISDCDALTFIARGKLPSSLKRLKIENFKKLQHLIDVEEHASSSSLPFSVTLKDPSILSCPELTTLSSRIQFPELEYLYIKDCRKLESIPDGLHNLNCLWKIHIDGCPSLVSFAERGLPNTISDVYISDCTKLEALPNNIHKLDSLLSLTIVGCPNIVSFPEEGFPANLIALTIDNVKMYKALIQWGLHRLTFLRNISIVGCHDAESFPDEETGMLLPASLRDLNLRGLSKLKYLSSTGFQNFSSSQSLYIFDCPNLKSFPDVGIPSSLRGVLIIKCPMLKKQCQRGKGKEWFKIAMIYNQPLINKFASFIKRL